MYLVIFLPADRRGLQSFVSDNLEDCRDWISKRNHEGASWEINELGKQIDASEDWRDV